jgi:hypothetical protein
MNEDLFESIILDQEQKDLICWMIENIRNVPRNERSPFILVDDVDGLDGYTLVCDGLPNKKVLPSDLDSLSEVGLLRQGFIPNGNKSFDITPKGYKYYEYLKTNEGKPLKIIEEYVFKYFEPESFQKNYTRSYKKWFNAANLLWKRESPDQLTTIGHLCREAIQEFATKLVERYNPQNVDTDKTHTKNRLKSVLEYFKNRMGKTEKEFIDVLIDYWDKLIDYWDKLNELIQRQVHDSAREKSELIWEDGRRIVFHTAILMFEIDRITNRYS